MVTRPVVLSRLIDTSLVLVFAAVGRASHGEDVGVGGVVTTAVPFVLGSMLGWALALIAASTRSRPTGLRAGVVVWLSTVVVGMVLRAVTGRGVQLSFVVVATVVLGVFLLGWRGVVALVRRARRETRADAQV